MVISVFTIFNINLPVYSATGIKSFTQTGFGVDVGTATFHYASNKLSFVNGASNTTLNLPSLTVAVATTNCAIAQSSLFTHNSTKYHWHFSGASACNGRALTTTMDIYIQNTSQYYIKKLYGTVTTVRAGTSASITNKVLWQLTSNQPASNCNQTNCKVQCFGSTCFDWSAFPSFSYNNQTNTVTAISGSSSASITTFNFDPLAIDGTAGGSCNNANCGLAALTTSNANDIIYCNTVMTNGATTSITSSPSLTFTKRLDKTYHSHDHISTWYAIWSSSGAITMTVHFNASDFSDNFCFGISGADTSSTFDPNAAIPKSAQGHNALATVTISTSNSNDMLLGLVGDKGQTFTHQTGFSTITTQGNAYGEYEVVSATQTNLAVKVTLGGTDYWGEIADAVKQASSCATFCTTLSETYSYSQTLTTISLSNQLSETATYSETLTSINLANTVYWGAPIFDNFNNTQCSGCSTANFKLTTNLQPDLILLFVATVASGYTCGTNHSPPSVTSIVATNLPFTFRNQNTSDSLGVTFCDKTHIEEWYAKANSTLSKLLITVNLNFGNSSTAMGVTANAITQYGTFDTTCKSKGSGNNPSCSITTTNTNDLVMAAGSTSNANAMCTQGNLIGINGFGYGMSGYEIPNVILTSSPISWLQCHGNINGRPWTELVDSVIGKYYSESMQDQLTLALSQTYLYTQSLANSLALTFSNVYLYAQSISGTFGCSIFSICLQGGSTQTSTRYEILQTPDYATTTIEYALIAFFAIIIIALVIYRQREVK